MHSPYQQLRKPVKIDIHPGGLDSKVSKWIKPVSSTVVVPDDVLQVLDDEIEKRHAGGPRAEEIVWIQEPRPKIESIRNSWAAGLCLCMLMIGLFGGAGIGLTAPSFLLGTALVPPIIAVVVCWALANRVRCDLKGWYALTKSRAIICVPQRHLWMFKPLVISFNFTHERSLIVHKLEQAGIHELILKREPKLADFFHTKHSTGEVTFYPRTKLQIPFHWGNIQNSHAFEMIFNDTILNSQAPTNGGTINLDKQNSFQQQKAASRRYKLYPVIGIIWIVLLLASVTGPAWGIWSAEVRTSKTIAMAVLSWITIQVTLIAVFYPVYRNHKMKWEARANGRYMRFMVAAGR